MRRETVDIFSEQTNAAVIRHPGRHFPGVLVQGDSLFTLCKLADEVCQEVSRGTPGYDEATEMRNALWSLLSHYKKVLGEHDLALPFSE